MLKQIANIVLFYYKYLSSYLRDKGIKNIYDFNGITASNKITDNSTGTQSILKFPWMSQKFFFTADLLKSELKWSSQTAFGCSFKSV